jgi:hypothetical protein
VPVSFGAEHDHRMEERDGGRWRLLTKRKREMGRGPARAVPCGGRRGVWARLRHAKEDDVGGWVGWQPTACGGAALAASRQRRVRVGVTARRSRGTGWRVWATHECVGRPGEGRSGAGPERTMPILI